MNISEMKAGRELDTQVAEKVMGWHKDERPGHFHWLDNDNETTGYDWLDKPIKAFSPSTKIAAAWEVVEKMAAAGFDWDLASDEVTFQRGNYDKPDYVCATVVPKPYGENIPEVICLAALKAVEQVNSNSWNS